MPTKLNDISVSLPDSLTTSPSHGSGEISPTLDDVNGNQPFSETLPTARKKKKKKKSKKSAKTKDVDSAPTKAEPSDLNGRPPILCISRNKHWRYISSYHVCLYLPSLGIQTDLLLRDHGYNSPSNF
jgi:hypothetical protein